MNWNDYFFSICNNVATRSKCLSRQIGCVITKDNAIISTGYNGPPRGYPHCQTVCPRKLKPNYESGKGLDDCPATHAEQNAIAQAARSGVSINGATLYLNTVLPCKTCMGLIINAGIKTVQCRDIGCYDKLGLDMARQCNIDIIQNGCRVIFNEKGDIV